MAKSSKKKAPAKKKSAKKSTGGAKKRTTKASPKPAARKKTARSKASALTSDERRSMVKPPTDYTELVGDTIDAWKQHSKAVRVANRTPAQLARLLRDAERAAKREKAFLEQMEDKARVLSDARIRAEHDMWSTTLAVYGVVKAQTRTAPELEAAFEHLAEVFSRKPTAKPTEDPPTPPPAQ